MNVLLTFPFRLEDAERLKDIEGCRIIYSADPSDDLLAYVDVIMGQPSIEQIRKADKLKWIQCTSAGVDPYMVHKELFDDLILTNVSGAFGQSISEYVLTMVLNLYKHMHIYRDRQHEAAWIDEGRQESPRNNTLLILGAGNIGQETARLFSIFDCHTIGLVRTMRPVPDGFERLITVDELDEVLPDADIIVGALPGTPETVGLLGGKRLSLLKPSAILINIGRGSLIDADFLADMLNKGRLAGAALDVTVPEPLPKNHPLWRCKNAIITPHITGGSFGHLTATEEIIYDICRTNLKRFVSGEPLLNVVDPSTGYRKNELRY